MTLIRTAFARALAWLTFAQLRLLLSHADDALAWSAFGRNVLLWIVRHVEPEQVEAGATLVEGLDQNRTGPDDHFATLLHDFAAWLREQRAHLQGDQP